MADVVPASGTVHWIGAGLSTGSGLTALCETAGHIRLWHRTEERAAQALERLGLLRELVEVGLGGLETFHASFDEATRVSVGTAARTLALVQTGGTDYHGDLGSYAESISELVIEPVVEDFARSMVRS
jgi:hypothetical protein